MQIHSLVGNPSVAIARSLASGVMAKLCFLTHSLPLRFWLLLELITLTPTRLHSFSHHICVIASLSRYSISLSAPSRFASSLIARFAYRPLSPPSLSWSVTFNNLRHSTHDSGPTPTTYLYQPLHIMGFFTGHSWNFCLIITQYLCLFLHIIVSTSFGDGFVLFFGWRFIVYFCPLMFYILSYRICFVSGGSGFGWPLRSG
jgi:hypothetical protein